MEEKEFHQQLLELRPRLLTWALNRVQSYEDAEDLVQDTLVRAIRARAQFNDACGSLKTWVSFTMRNRSYDLRRSKGSWTFVEITEHNVQGHTETPSQQVRVELMEAVAIICTFPEAVQDTLRLTFLGYTDVEIAGLKDLPLGTVKSHITKSRRKVQKRLALL